MSIAALANFVTVHEKVIVLLNRELGRSVVCKANTSLQTMGADSLNLSDVRLQDFLDGPIRTTFGVKVANRNLKKVINGLHPTVGDLSIAVFNRLQHEHRPRRVKFVVDPTGNGAKKVLVR